VDGLRLPVTTPARTIIDLLASGEEPSYVQRAMVEALASGRATAAEIMEAARHRRPTRTRGLEAATERLLKAST
jgi:hypothetical protein